MLQSHYTSQSSEIDMMRRELQGLRMENAHLRESANAHAAAAQPAAAPATSFSDPFASSSRTELPPLRSLSGSLPNGPESMTGVQYDAPRVNGYREGRF